MRGKQNQRYWYQLEQATGASPQGEKGTIQMVKKTVNQQRVDRETDKEIRRYKKMGTKKVKF